MGQPVTPRILIVSFAPSPYSIHPTFSPPFFLQYLCNILGKPSPRKYPKANDIFRTGEGGKNAHSCITFPGGRLPNSFIQSFFNLYANVHDIDPSTFLIREGLLLHDPRSFLNFCIAKFGFTPFPPSNFDTLLAATLGCTIFIRYFNIHYIESLIQLH